MNYLIIVLVIGLMLSPVFWLMPSPSQKRQMLLRQYAMSLGFQIKVCDLPQTHRQSVRKEAPEQGVVYRLPWLEKFTGRNGFQQLLIRGDDNPALSETSPELFQLMRDRLEQLPDCVYALEISASGVGIYWKERATVEQVKTLYDWLVTLRNEYQSLR